MCVYLAAEVFEEEEVFGLVAQLVGVGGVLDDVVLPHHLLQDTHVSHLRLPPLIPHASPLSTRRHITRTQLSQWSLGAGVGRGGGRGVGVLLAGGLFEGEGLSEGEQIGGGEGLLLGMRGVDEFIAFLEFVGGGTEGGLL